MFIKGCSSGNTAHILDHTNVYILVLLYDFQSEGEKKKNEAKNYNRI